MSKNKQNLEDKVEQLKKELKDAEEQLKNYDNMSPVHQLAVDLHELFCNQNHILCTGAGCHMAVMSKPYQRDQSTA